jgi:hypothetical protein
MKFKVGAFFFHSIEAFAFLLPAFPKNFTTRLSILTIYFIGHVSGLQKKYSIEKRKYSFLIAFYKK